MVDFNSTIVRLKVRIFIESAINLYKFQFYDSTIKSAVTNLDVFNIENFNSTIVRLKVRTRARIMTHSKRISILR